MKKIYIYSLILVLLILQSCSYEPKGEEFIKLDPTGKAPNVEVNLNFTTDTIYLQRNEQITFSYTVNGDKVNWAKFIINGKEINIESDRTGTIQLPWLISDADFAKGTFPMEMNIYTHSQTGSIADKIGAEGFLLSKTWTVVVKDSYNLGSKITNFEFVDGSQKITWEKYKGINFQNYQVYKGINNTSGSFYLLTSIISQDQTSFIDNTYHGEDCYYWIVTNGKYVGKNTVTKGPIPLVTATNTISGDILLKWTKPPFYKNLKGYRISYLDSHGNMQLLADINNPETESFVIPNPFFGFYYDISLTLVPLTNNYYADFQSLLYLSSKVKTSYGVTSPVYRIAKAGLAPVSYLLYDPTGITVFDHQNFTTTRRIQYPEIIFQFDVSASNKYLLSVINSPKKFYLEDLTDPAKNKKLELAAAFPLMGYYASVSNIGTGVFLNGQSVVLYDYLNETKLAEAPLSFNGENGNDISPSGNFIYVFTYSGYDYFQYKDNQLIHLPANKPTGSYFLIHVDFLPGNSEKIVRTYSSMIEVIDCNTWTVEKQWTNVAVINEVYNLDLKSGKLFIREGLKLELFNVMTGIKEIFPTTTESTYLNTEGLFFNNGQILWGQGKMLK